MQTLTCVYCGMAYPEGTPPFGSKILTDHIRVCEKHPLREAELTILKLKKVIKNLSESPSTSTLGRVLFKKDDPKLLNAVSKNQTTQDREELIRIAYAIEAYSLIYPPKE